jgi:hypothetical protein
LAGLCVDPALRPQCGDEQNHHDHGDDGDPRSLDHVAVRALIGKWPLRRAVAPQEGDEDTTTIANAASAIGR